MAGLERSRKLGSRDQHPILHWNQHAACHAGWNWLLLQAEAFFSMGAHAHLAGSE
jgi:hypothetical protein